MVSKPCGPCSHCAHETERNYLPGGYLGVDIFFVISGFVITKSLLSRQFLSAGQLMLDFYARRMKRLLPALVLVVITGALLIRLFDPKPITSTATGALALIGASNIFLFGEAVDYFGGAAALNIFTHTWSLGVEEQFYLAYPLLFCLTANVSSSIRLAILAVLSLASVIAFIVVAKINQPAAFFLMPFRFWELGLGCLASLAIAHHQTHLALSPAARVASIRSHVDRPCVAGRLAGGRNVTYSRLDDYTARDAFQFQWVTASHTVEFVRNRLHRADFLFALPVALAGDLFVGLDDRHPLVVHSISNHCYFRCSRSFVSILGGAAALRPVDGQRLEDDRRWSRTDHFWYWSDRGKPPWQPDTILPARVRRCR